MHSQHDYKWHHKMITYLQNQQEHVECIIKSLKLGYAWLVFTCVLKTHEPTKGYNQQGTFGSLGR